MRKKRKWCQLIQAATEEIPPSPTLPFLLPLDTHGSSPFCFHVWLFFVSSVCLIHFSLFSSLPLSHTLMFHLFSSADKRQFVLRLIQLIDLLVFFIETSLPTDRLILWRSKNPFFLSCFGCCPNSDISVSTSKMFHINISPTVIAHTEWTISPWQQSTTCCTDKWADIFPSYTSRVARGNCYCGPGINDVIKSGHK